MEKIIDFISENYELIILLCACLLDLILFLVGVFKKIKLPVKEAVIELLPKLIVKAEKLYGSGHGQEKKVWVLNAAASYYEKFSKIPTSVFSGQMLEIGEALEEILKTPTKKGDK